MVFNRRYARLLLLLSNAINIAGARIMGVFGVHDLWR